MDKKAKTLKPEVVVHRWRKIVMTHEIPVGTQVWVGEKRSDGTCTMVMGRDGREKEDPFNIGMINHSAIEGVDYELI